MPEFHLMPTSDGLPSFLTVITEKDCFVCNKPLLNSRSNEHVFPKWLSRKFGLSNKKLVLPNGTNIRYKHLRIPCCNSCNTTYLSSLESYMKVYVDGGYEMFVTVDERKLFMWASKIFYGLLRKDMVLLTDRTDPESDSVIDPILVDRYFNLQTWLQTMRNPGIVLEPSMWSFFVFRMRTATGFDEFDFADHYLSGSVMMRLHDVGFIMCLGDNGSQANYFRSIYSGVKNIPLHPVQLRELFARICYNLTRLNFIHQGNVIIKMSDAGLEKIRVKPVFKNPGDTVPRYEDEDPRALAKLLHVYLQVFGLSANEVFKPPDKCISYVSTEKGDFHVYDKEDDAAFLIEHSPPTPRGNP